MTVSIGQKLNFSHTPIIKETISIKSAILYAMNSSHPILLMKQLKGCTGETSRTVSLTHGPNVASECHAPC